MKDNKKGILIVVGILAVLLIILALLHGCNKKEQPKKSTPKKDTVEVVENTPVEEKEDYAEEVQVVKVTPLVAKASTEQILTLTLVGEDTIYVDGNAAFNDPGAFASDTVDGTISSKISVKTYLVAADGTKTEVQAVDTTMGGATFLIEYSVSNSAGVTKTITRKVIINDIKNVDIAINGAPTVNLNLGDAYVDSGITAIETINGVDNVLTPTITYKRVNGQGQQVDVNNFDTNIAGTYYEYYTVVSSDGANYIIARNIIITDVTDPTITLTDTMVKNGTYTIQIGEDADIPATYTVTDDDASFVADDTTVAVVIKDSTDTEVTAIDNTIVGSYTVTITATDPSGNDATETYTLKVAPIIDVTIGDTIQQTWQNVDYRSVTVNSIVDGTNNGANVISNYTVQRWSASRNRYENTTNPFNGYRGTEKIRLINNSDNTIYYDLELTLEGLN